MKLIGPSLLLFLSLATGVSVMVAGQLSEFNPDHGEGDLAFNNKNSRPRNDSSAYRRIVSRVDVKGYLQACRETIVLQIEEMIQKYWDQEQFSNVLRSNVEYNDFIQEYKDAKNYYIVDGNKNSYMNILKQFFNIISNENKNGMISFPQGIECLFAQAEELNIRA